MADIRKELHEEIDLMNEYEMVKLKDVLDTFPSKAHAIIRRAPESDEELSDEVLASLEENEQWLKKYGGIPDEEIKREFGFK